ncbi:MAG TPA: hypothetical protein VGF82_30280 [Terracidiphilus sp.]
MCLFPSGPSAIGTTRSGAPFLAQSMQGTTLEMNQYANEAKTAQVCPPVEEIVHDHSSSAHHVDISCREPGPGAGAGWQPRTKPSERDRTSGRIASRSMLVQRQSCYYIQTDASDQSIAAQFGINYVPLLSGAIDGQAVDDIYHVTNFNQGNVIPSAPIPPALGTPIHITHRFGSSAS